MIEHQIDPAIAARFVGRKYYHSSIARRLADMLRWEDVISVIYDEDEQLGSGYFCVEYAAGKDDLSLLHKCETAKDAVIWFNRRSVYRKKHFIVDYELLRDIWYDRYRYWKERREEEEREREEGFHPSSLELNGCDSSCVCAVCIKVSLYAVAEGDIHAVAGYRRGLSQYHCIHNMTIEEYIQASGYGLDDPFALAYHKGVEEGH